MATVFSNAVWSALHQVPRGRVTTYSELARAVGNPKAVRAVGQALKRNPNAPQCPCHRVVSSYGTLGGYNGEMNSARKTRLLLSEGVKIVSGRVQGFEKVFWKFPDR